MTSAIVLAMAAEMPLVRVFGLPGIRLVVLAAPMAGVVAGIMGTAWRRPRPVAGLIAGLLAGSLPGILLARPDPFTPASLGPRLEQAVTDGWYRLLSVPVPVPFTRSFTDLPYLVAALIAALIVLLAGSARPATALIPAAVSFAGWLVLGAGGPVAGAVLVATFGVAAAVFTGIVAPSVPLGTAARGAVGGVAVLALATLVTSGLHAGRPYNPRATVQPPVNVTVSQDPMALISARLTTPDVPVLTARLSGGLITDPRNWVLLTYDSYDGEGWQAPGDARPAVTASAVPGVTETGTAVVTVAQPAVVLPHPALVTSTSPADLSYNPESELLASAAAISGYTARAWVTDPSADALSSAAVPAGAPAAVTMIPACARALLAPLAQQVQSATGLPGAQAALLARRLGSAPYTYAPKAPPGEGCASITSLFSGPHKGTSAQFATVFALTARLLGLPARVAVGYLPGRIADGVDLVTDGDAYAWAQVDLAGLGWVDFDPTPRDPSAKNSPAREKQPGIQKLENAKQSKPGPSGPARAMPPLPVTAGLSAAARALLIGGGVMLAVLAWIGSVRLWTARRRGRRRRTPSPPDRVLGAWDELLLPLRQAGIPVRGLSAPGVASAAAAVLPGARSGAMAQLVKLTERAIYSSDVAAADADLAWQLSDQLRRPALAAASRWTRLRRLLVPARGRDT